MFFPRISRASDGMNAQSASFFARMVYVHPELAGYLHNTSNLSLIESWMTDVVGMGPSEMYDMDTVALLSVKGRTNLADDFVTLPRRSLAWAYALATDVNGPDIEPIKKACPSATGAFRQSEDSLFFKNFNFAMMAISRVGGGLDSGDTSGFWKGYFTDAFARRTADIVRACPADVNPIIFVQDVNRYGLDGAVSVHCDGMPREYIEALVA